MALSIQFDLFEENDDVSILYRELKKASESQDKLRKVLFSRHGDLMKLYALQQEEIMLLKRFLIENQGAKIGELTPKPNKSRKKNNEKIS